jgi:hypothetical protein
MNKTERIDETYREAIRKLDLYIKTGCDGFLTQAIERLQSIGVDCSRVPRNREGAKLLLAHISN